jgi:hypothetical protein
MASNQLNLVALNTTPTAAVSNYQRNTGVGATVTATASSVSFNLAAATGAIGGSTLRSSANAVTATAVGNSGVSSISGR